MVGQLLLLRLFDRGGGEANGVDNGAVDALCGLLPLHNHAVLNNEAWR